MKVPKIADSKEGKPPKKPRKLRQCTDLQQAFALAYVEIEATGKANGTEAARRAKYRGSDAVLAQVAHQNLRSPQVKALIEQIRAEAGKKAPVTRFRRILGISEILALTSFLASASLDMVLDENGHFDINKARETGGIHALSRLKIINTTRHYKSGTVDHIVRHEFALRDKNFCLELMGKHLNLWTGEIDDPDEVLSRLLGIPKHLLPTSLDDPPDVEGEIVGGNGGTNH